MDTTQLRYILFMLDSRFPEHDGKVFCSLGDAREYARECIADKYCTQFVVGMFRNEPEAREMHIEFVERFGFRGDKTKTNQLALFQK